MSVDFKVFEIGEYKSALRFHLQSEQLQLL